LEVLPWQRHYPRIAREIIRRGITNCNHAVRQVRIKRVLEYTGFDAVRPNFAASLGLGLQSFKLLERLSKWRETALAEGVELAGCNLGGLGVVRLFP